MLALSSTQRIYLALGVTDLRRGFNGLYGMIQQQFGDNPVSGALYIFCNRRRDAVKIFGYEDGGFWVCAKRLERGTFRWPEVRDLPASVAAARTIPLSASAVQLLLSGIDLPSARERDWWQRELRQPAQHPREQSTIVPAAL